MVLADLGRKINSALTDLAKAPVVDEKVVIIVALLWRKTPLDPYNSFTYI